MILKYVEKLLDKEDLFKYLWKNFGYHWGSSYTLKIPRRIICHLFLTKKDIVKYFNDRYFLIGIILNKEDIKII